VTRFSVEGAAPTPPGPLLTSPVLEGAASAAPWLRGSAALQTGTVGRTGYSVLRSAGWVALVAALLTAAGALLPLPPEWLRAENSFYATLHFALANRLRAGRDIIGTFGPLGFLFVPVYFPDTFAWLLGLRALLAATTCWTLAWIGYVAWRGPWGAAIAVGGCAPFLASPDVWFLLVPLLAALIELPQRPAPRALQLALGAAIGVIALIKFSFLVNAVAVLAPLTAVALLVRRRLPVVTTAAAVSAAAAWVATGHAVADWLPYLDWSREITDGYPSAMWLRPDPALTADALRVGAALLAAGALVAWRHRRWRGWVFVPVLAAVLVLFFKAGFMRPDVHVYITCFGLLVIAVLLALLWGPGPLRVAIASVLIALLPGRLWMHTIAAVGPPTLFFPPVFPPQAVERLIAGVSELCAGAFAVRHAGTLQGLRTRVPLPTLHGSIDVYSYDQEIPLAYADHYRPRPVYASYMAWTPRLARANADALRGDRAPRWILFRVSPLDGNVPALDDAPSWPLLLTGYHFSQNLGGFALLERRTMPLDWHLEPLERMATSTDALVPVPAAGRAPIWARIDVRETWRDALVRSLIAAPPATLVLAYGDGQARRYRFNATLARDGFLLSPLVDSTADFVALATAPNDALPERRVTALMVTDIDRCPMDVEFFRLVIDDAPAS